MNSGLPAAGGLPLIVDGDGHAAGRVPTLPLLFGAFRRRKKVWLFTGIVGAMAAVGLFVLSPPAHTASTTMLLGNSEGIDPNQAIDNDVQLLKTKTVARRAIAEAGLQATAQELQSASRVDLLANRVLRLNVAARSGTEAVQRAQAIANAFLSFRAEELDRQAQAEVETLQTRASALNSDLLVVNGQIATASTGTDPRNEVSVRALADLLSRRTAISDELLRVNQRMEGANLNPRIAAKLSRIIDVATEEPRRVTSTLLVSLLAGLIGGAGAGMALIVVRAVTSDRVNRVDEVSAFLHAPVAATIGRYRRSLPGQRRRFLRHQPASEPTIAPVVRHLRRLIGHAEANSRLALVSVHSDVAAAVALASTAVELVEEGTGVTLVDLSAGSTVAALFNAGREMSSVYTGESGARLWLAAPNLESGDGGAGQVPEDVRAETSVTLSLATLDPAIGADHLVVWADTAVVIVTAGRSSSAQVRSTSLLLRQAGIAVDSAVLVDMDENVALVPRREPSLPDAGEEFSERSAKR